MAATEKGMNYEIRVQGVLDVKWAALFAPLSIQPQQDTTLISGVIQDQAELFGVLLKIRDMGVELASVNARPGRAQAFPVLTTPRLLLREFSMADAPAVLDIFSRPDVNHWLETTLMQSIEDAQARLRGRIGLFNDGLGVRWAVTLREDPARAIGSCGFFSVRRGTHSVETGYELHPDFWRKGIMTEAMQAMIEYGFSSQALFPIHRIEALIAPGNTASIRLLEKLAFTQEGLRREFFRWDDRYQDVYIYSLLNA